MSILEVSGLKKTFGEQTIFEDVSFLVAAKDKIGIIGSNGCGKTTLLRSLAGLCEVDAGSMKIASGYSLGYLAQDVKYTEKKSLYEETLSACSHLFLLRDRLVELEEAMASSKHDSRDDRLSPLLKEYDLLLDEFNRKGGYDYDYRLKSVLYGLGFTQKDLSLIVDNFSGGQKVRVTLAKLLISNPDILLLDEPTNHLDTEAIEWLEDYLSSFSGSFIVVSHDRYFLDKVTTKTFHIEDKILTEYDGNYSYYLNIYEFNRARQMSQFERQQELIQKYEEYIRRYKAGNRSTMAQSREKMLARLNRIEKPTDSASMKIRIEPTIRSGRKAIIVDNLKKSYGNKVLFANLDLILERGERLGIVGPNGSGKTTFLKIIAEDIPPDHGKVVYGENVKVGTFSQDLAELNENLTVLDEVYKFRNWTQSEARNYLARFLFKGESVFKNIRSLSGGERNRLILAKLFLSAPNVILFDEPTNHLDISARQALEAALSEYDGTVITASHDRYFLDQIATSILEISCGNAKIYGGNYSYYKEKKREEVALKKSEAQPMSNLNETKFKPENRKVCIGEGYNISDAQKMNSKSLRQLKVKLDNEMKLLEENIKKSEDRSAELESMLADTALYAEAEKLRLVVFEHEQLQEELAGLYDKWAAVTEERENLNESI